MLSAVSPLAGSKSGYSAAAAPATFSGNAYTVGPTVSPTTTGPEAEEHIAVDPTNPNTLVAAISDFSSTRDVWGDGEPEGVRKRAAKKLALTAKAARAFFNAKPGSLEIPDMAIDKLLARGTIFGACNVALHFLSAKFASAAGVTPEVALKDWTAGIIPGITVIPSGTWGVNRVQEVGCSYCAGGAE